MRSADDVEFSDSHMKKWPKYLYSYTHELVHVPSSPLKAQNAVPPSQVGGGTLNTWL